jgi:glucose/arabinose dehydrogenase
MTEEAPSRHAPCQRCPRLRLLLAGTLALAVVLYAGYRLAPLSVAVPPLLAVDDSRLEAAMKARAQLPQGYRIALHAVGLPKARLMIETARGDLVVSSRGDAVHLVTADRDGDGRADAVRTLLDGLDVPHGILIDGGYLYVAEQTRVSRWPFDAATGTLTGGREDVLDGLPGPGGHVTRTLKQGPDGWLYLSIGSSCNVCIEEHPWRAAIIRFHPGEPPQVYATGLRNTVGFDWQPATDQLYGVDNGRDWLGDDFPPEDVNRIEQGRFYGWPYRHGDNVADPEYGARFSGEAVPPAFKMEAHIAPLAIRFLRHQRDPAMNGIALVAQHGSWNRTKKNGYRLIALRFAPDGSIASELFLTGFLDGDRVIGRPVDILERANGDLLVSDDFNGVIWRVSRGP